MKTSTFLALIVAALATPLAAQETYFGVGQLEPWSKTSLRAHTDLCIQTCRGANGRCYTEATGTMTCTEGRVSMIKNSPGSHNG